MSQSVKTTLEVKCLRIPHIPDHVKSILNRILSLNRHPNMPIKILSTTVVNGFT